jgi:hypothetical protein
MMLSSKLLTFAILPCAIPGADPIPADPCRRRLREQQVLLHILSGFVRLP